MGSQTAMELMKTLSVKNNFHYHKDRTQKVETIKLTYNEEVRCHTIHPLALNFGVYNVQ